MSTGPIPEGYCLCGCGEKVRKKYKNGHQNRNRKPEYIEMDMGYETPCHIWQRTTDGVYGLVWGEEVTGSKYKTKRAHQVVWEKAHGPVPDGYDVHHLCGQTRCVKVDHLILLTHSEHASLHMMGNQRWKGRLKK